MSLRLFVFMLAAGVLQSVALAWPEGPWRGAPSGSLQLVALAALAATIDRIESARHVFRATWAFASAWLITCTWWLYISLHHHGHMPAPLAAGAVVLLGVTLALLYAGAMWVYHRTMVQTAPRAQRIMGFAAAWGLAEWTRGTIATGFPWGAIGYAHIDSVLRVWAPWVGVYGLSTLAAGLAMALAARREPHRRPATTNAVLGVALGIALAASAWLSPARDATQLNETDTAITVALLQGNVPQDQKFNQQAEHALAAYRDNLLHTPADLVVTPETALTFLPEHLPASFWAALRSVPDKALIVGTPLRADQNRPGHYTNSALGLVPGRADDYRYDKHHLVPFGEFVPPLFQWFVDRMHMPMGQFARGPLAQPPLAWRGQRISLNICFEDLFGEELAQSFAHAQTAPTLLLNISNLAWFGDTVALDQHLHISRMRALELGRPLLRATNTGATAVINAQGDVVARLPYETQGTLTHTLHGIDGPITPYAYGVARWGVWPGVVALLLAWAWAAWWGRAQRQTHRRFGN